MTEGIKTNRLSIFLIKEEYRDHEEILKDFKNLKAKALGPGGTLYWKPSGVRQPRWVKTFFDGEVESDDFLAASSQAILIAEVDVDGSTKRLFALPFGTGHHLILSGAAEERFGLKIVLNSVDENMLRSIDKKDMSNIPIQAREQISVHSSAADFGINIEQDLILGVTGRSKDPALGQTISGKDALCVAVKIDVHSLSEFLRHCYSAFQKVDYRVSFGWIDQISELRDKPLIAELDKELVKQIASKSLSKLWMALPDVLEWEDIAGFRYADDVDAELEDDIFLDSFLEQLPADTDVTLELLKKSTVFCYSRTTEEVVVQWRVYKCLYCEISRHSESFLLTNGKWYRLEDSFLRSIDKEYSTILSRAPVVSLPDYSHKDEEQYNKACARGGLFELMDRKMIKFGGGYSKIEFCDLFSPRKEMVHVKYYGGSSVLSHLFSQGLVAAETLASSSDFRKRVNAELRQNRIEEPLNTGDFHVVYAIISASRKPLDIPFFSKVTLKNAKVRLEGFGFKVSLQKILATKPKKARAKSVTRTTS